MKPSDLNLSISRQTLPEQFAFQIEELIHNSSLAPGSRLPGERELAEQYKLSRSVIREALGILQARGLVHSRPGKGTFITQLSREDSVKTISRCLKFSDPPLTGDNLIQMRLAIEPAAASAAALHADKADREKLQAILDMLKTPDTPDEDFIKQDLEFHLSIGKASGNPLFAVMIDSITGILYDFMKEVFEKNIKNVRPYVIDRHTRILKCIADHDSDGAHKTMQEHIETAVPEN